MDLHQLRLFQALATTGSFSRAAEICHISQPALWIHIKHLEEELQITLVDRLPRGIRLTDAGKVVVEYSQRIFSTTDDLKTSIDDLRGIKAGRLVMGASTTPGIYLLPGALGRFKQQYPGIELDLRIANTQQVEDWVLNHEVALGIIGQEPLSTDVQTEFYLKDTLVAIVWPEHKWATRKSISITDLAKEPFLAREPGSNTRKTYEEAFRKNGVSIQIAMELGSTEAIKRAVVAQLGVSIVSPYALQWERARKQLVGLKLRQSGFERPFNIIYHKRSRLSTAAQAFIKILLAKPDRS